MFKPNGDRLALKLIEPEEKTPGGIVIPDVAKEKPVWGKVVAKGDGAFSEKHGIRIPVSYLVNDVVCFSRYSGSEVTCDGEKYLVVKESDVLGSR